MFQRRELGDICFIIIESHRDRDREREEEGEGEGEGKN